MRGGEARVERARAVRADEAVAPIFRLLGEGRLAQREIEALVTVLEADTLPEVPSARLTLARQIADAPGAAARELAPAHAPSLPRLLTAALQANVSPFSAAAGMRGGAAAVHRLLFAVDEYEVVVQGASRPKQQGQEVTGQILRDGDPVPSAAILLAGATQRVETEADEDGSFRFGGIAEGSYELDVWAGGWRRGSGDRGLKPQCRSDTPCSHGRAVSLAHGTSTSRVGCQTGRHGVATHGLVWCARKIPSAWEGVTMTMRRLGYDHAAVRARSWL
jgi:hypothetical protein